MKLDYYDRRDDSWKNVIYNQDEELESKNPPNIKFAKIKSKRRFQNPEFNRQKFSNDD